MSSTAFKIMRIAVWVEKWVCELGGVSCVVFYRDQYWLLVLSPTGKKKNKSRGEGGFACGRAVGSK